MDVIPSDCILFNAESRTPIDMCERQKSLLNNHRAGGVLPPFVPGHIEWAGGATSGELRAVESELECKTVRARWWSVCLLEGWWTQRSASVRYMEIAYMQMPLQTEPRWASRHRADCYSLLDCGGCDCVCARVACHYINNILWGYARIPYADSNHAITFRVVCAALSWSIPISSVFALCQYGPAHAAVARKTIVPIHHTRPRQYWVFIWWLCVCVCVPRRCERCAFIIPASDAVCAVLLNPQTYVLFEYPLKPTPPPSPYVGVLLLPFALEPARLLIFCILHSMIKKWW